MATNLSNCAKFWPVKIKLNGLLAIAVMVLAGCDQNVDYFWLELGEEPGAETDRRIKAMGKPPAPDPRAKKMWGTDLRAAIMRARKNNKRILLAYMISSNEVGGFQWNFIYTQPRFLDFAQKELELVKVDWSQRIRADAEEQKLSEIFGKPGSPAYFVLDPEGRIVWPKNAGSFGPQPDFYNLDGVNRTSAAGTVPRSAFYIEREKEFIKRLKLILKGTEPIQGKANIKTAGVSIGNVEVEIRDRLRKPAGDLTKADLDRVTALSFSETDITDHELKELVKVDQITSLWLRLCPQVTSEGFKELGKLKQLNRLCLSGPNITDATLKEVAKLQQITWLDLDCPKVTDKGLEEVAKLQQIAWLDLDCPKVTDKGLEEVAKLQQIAWLSLDCPKVTDKGLEELGRLKNLNTLYLKTSLVTKTGKSKLRKALPGCWFSIMEPSYVQKGKILKPPKKAPLTAKETSEIIETAIGRQLDKPSSELTKMDRQRVTELKFTFTKISDASLKEVAKLNQLKILWLDNNQITDTGLKELSKLQQLTHLGLAGTYVTDEGIQHLHNLKNLTSITLGRTNVTIDGVAALKRALPDCDIHYYR
jgi:Leucine-rich repeat (LRR) protein